MIHTYIQNTLRSSYYFPPKFRVALLAETQLLPGERVRRALELLGQQVRDECVWMCVRAQESGRERARERERESVCTWMRAREREQEREKLRERERERERESARERERGRERKRKREYFVFERDYA